MTTPIQPIRRNGRSCGVDRLLRSAAAAAVLSLCLGCDEGDGRAVVDAGRLADASSDAAAPDAANPEDAAPEDAAAPDRGLFRLTVEAGYGSGRYPAGARVHAFAASDPFTEVVTEWRGGDAHPAEWHLSFEMPDRDLSLTPIAERVELELRERTVQGVTTRKRLYSHVPEGARGLVFFLHGTGGSADVIQKPAMFQLALRATRLGYAVISPEALETTLGDQNGDGARRWDATPELATNIDAQDILGYAQALVEGGAIAEDAPRFAIGMSNGGAFAVTLGAIAPGFTAVVSYCATGRADAFRSTETPTAWFMCANDANETVAAKREAWPDGAAALAERGVRTDYDEHSASPLYPGRFARLRGVGVEASMAAVEELAVAGLLDAEGFLTVDAGEVTRRVEAEPRAFPAIRAVVEAGGLGRVRGELKAAWADHQIYDDWGARTFEFLQAD